MKIEVTQVTSWIDVVNAARWTERKAPIDHEPTMTFKRNMIIAEHAPIRLLEYDIKMYDIPYWVSVHFVRHHEGCEKFVSTQRDDRTNSAVSRNDAPQSAPVNLWMRCNAQSLINISRVRLCRKASPETRQIWHEVVQQVIALTPQFEGLLVPNCQYRHCCPEIKPCTINKL